MKIGTWSVPPPKKKQNPIRFQMFFLVDPLIPGLSKVIIEFSITLLDGFPSLEQVAPIFDGFLVERGMRTLGLGGKDITSQLGALVNAKVGMNKFVGFVWNILWKKVGLKV